jgi:hypothetical protein
MLHGILLSGFKDISTVQNFYEEIILRLLISDDPAIH